MTRVTELAVTTAIAGGGTGASRSYLMTVTEISRDGYVFDPGHSILEAGKAWF